MMHCKKYFSIIHLFPLLGSISEATPTYQSVFGFLQRWFPAKRQPNWQQQHRFAGKLWLAYNNFCLQFFSWHFRNCGKLVVECHSMWFTKDSGGKKMYVNVWKSLKEIRSQACDVLLNYCQYFLSSHNLHFFFNIFKNRRLVVLVRIKYAFFLEVQL